MEPSRWQDRLKSSGKRASHMASYGWVGRILRVNVTKREISEDETAPYAQEFVGGRGIAARLAWREIPPRIDAFDPDNRLIIMTGPLTGTLAPTSGRFEICGVAAQTYPTPHYTRSSVGGHWGPELKYAGYDGIVIRGKSGRPVYLLIQDSAVQFRDAEQLWGLDTFKTQQKLLELHGDSAQILCIGPAGENLVRIAVIQSGLENASGQGGFGAVMGSKRLKAIVVQGTGAVRIAGPHRFIEVCEQVRRIAHARIHACGALKEDRPPPRNHRSCSMACTAGNCALEVKRTPRGESFALHCCSGSYLALKPQDLALEAALLANKLGLNHWEIVNGFRGRQGWLPKCEEAGVLTDEEFGMPFKPLAADFWLELLRKIAYREGIGDILAEGWARAADQLGKAKEYLPHVAHGYQSHWDGHLYGAPRYPYWLVSALMWMVDSRDPFVHGYAQEITRWWADGKGPLSMDRIRAIAEKVHGSGMAVDPDSGYEWKAQPAVWHQNRDAVKDSLPVCDQIFPVFFSHYTEDGYGDTAAEAKLFSAVTGIDLTEKELDRVGERVFNLERAIMVREGRMRHVDEANLAYFKQPDNEGRRLDEERFGRLLDEFYAQRGWDGLTGRPSREKLEELGLDDVADELKRLGNRQ